MRSQARLSEGDGARRQRPAPACCPAPRCGRHGRRKNAVCVNAWADAGAKRAMTFPTRTLHSSARRSRAACGSATPRAGYGGPWERQAARRRAALRAIELCRTAALGGPSAYGDSHASRDGQASNGDGHRHLMLPERSHGRSSAGVGPRVHAAGVLTSVMAPAS